jgi:hypothetical protein
MTIEERLEDMERELRRVKRRNRWLLGAILLVVVGLIAPEVFETTAIRARSKEVETANEIRAMSFVLEDENGTVCAMLTATKDGPMLGLYDENGKTRAGLRLTKDGPDLVLLDENGKTRVMLAVLKDNSGLWLLDENGLARAGLGLVTKYGSGLWLYDKNGKVIWSAIK